MQRYHVLDIYFFFVCVCERTTKWAKANASTQSPNGISRW
jgi:hypothetical protein